MDNGSHIRDMLSGHTSQDKLFGSMWSLSLKEIRFSEQEFFGDRLVSNIKYHHPGL